MSFRYQIFNIETKEAWGYPYRYIGRALMRVTELNIFERANRYSLKPVRDLRP